MEIYTINQGYAEGAEIRGLYISSIDVKIPAVIVGEKGRGRSEGVVPVKLSKENKEKFDMGESVRIYYAEITQTRRGAPKLIETKEKRNPQHFLAVFMTDFGFRGGNNHTGDETEDGYKEFPGQILVTGSVAQGAAGRMGGGNQIVAKMEKEKVFREKLSGRMYGNPSEHFYKYEKAFKLLHVTGKERDYLDLF